MATGCPNNNCIALANWPRSELLDALPPGTTAKRIAPSAASPSEYYAAVASPTLQANGVPFNRVTLVVNVLTKGAAFKAYREQLKRAIEQLDKAASAGAASVEVGIQVPDELTGGSAGQIKTLGEEAGPSKKDKGKTSPKKKDVKEKDEKGGSKKKKKS
jgi:hypothetical protein